MEEEDLQLEMALAEVRLASSDLADFLVWVAQQDDLEEEFPFILAGVYAYARKSNEQSAEETARQEE